MHNVLMTNLVFLPIEKEISDLLQSSQRLRLVEVPGKAHLVAEVRVE